MRMLAAALVLLVTPAMSGVDAMVDDHILPGYDRFAAQATALAQSARQDCTAPALRPAFHAAFEAWMGIGHVRLGPVEAEGRILAIAFWPDTRGLTARTL